MPKRRAKIVPDIHIEGMLDACEEHRYAIRDQALVLLSFKAGLRAIEIAGITWHMVMTVDKAIDDKIVLENRIAKKQSGRVIPINPRLQTTLTALWSWYQHRRRTITLADPIILSERACRLHSNAPLEAMRPTSIGYFFYRLYKHLGLEGCSSHSGRRTFITTGARRINMLGGSLKDIQELAGHRSIQQTQDYIEGEEEAKVRFLRSI